MKLIQAQLVKAPRQVTTKYGIRTVADAIDENGNTQTIWRPENDPVLSRLTVNSRITLTMDAKGKINLVENTHQPAAIASQNEPTQGMSKQQKQDIAGYVTEQAKLFGFCLTQASMIEGIQPEDIRPIATTLYLQSVKHFGL